MRSWCKPQNSAQRPAEGADPGRRKGELVGPAGQGVAHEQELGHEELVHHVAGLEAHVDRLPDRHGHHRLLGERLAGDVEALVDVVEGPLPLEALDAQLDGRVGVALLDLGEGLLAEDEEEGHDRGRQGEEQRQRAYPAGRLRTLPALAAAVAQDAPEQHALDADEHRRRQDHDRHVQVVDLLALHGGALAGAAGQQRAGQGGRQPGSGDPQGGHPGSTAQAEVTVNWWVMPMVACTGPLPPPILPLSKQARA